MKSAFVLSLLLMSSFAMAQEAQTETKKNSKSYVLCKHKGTVRTIRVDVASSGACVATYTKEGVDQVVGKSGTSSACETIAKNIRTNLEKGEWTCQDKGGARISLSNDL